MKFKRKPKEALEHRVNVIHHGLEVTHTIQRKPDPIPISGRYRIYDQTGRYWDTTAFYIHGRQSMRTYIPRSWITGELTDHEQVQIELLLEY